MLAKNHKLEHLHKEPECHVVTKAFLISKNSTPVDILLLKCHAVMCEKTKVTCM